MVTKASELLARDRQHPWWRRYKTHGSCHRGTTGVLHLTQEESGAQEGQPEGVSYGSLGAGSLSLHPLGTFLQKQRQVHRM